MMDEGFHLDVGAGHRLWVTQYGAMGGQPILFLHGGPGSGCNAGQRDLFDPARHRVIFLDQRGAGKSLPKGARHANGMAEQLADIEALREHLGIEKWALVGGSWGATLALAYAERHPHRVSAMALRAVFLGTRGELDWAFGTALAQFHPLLHRAFLAPLTTEERADPLASYWRRILHPDPLIHGPAAWIWHDVERILSVLTPASDQLAAHEPQDPLPATPFMEAHYFREGCFLAEGALLRDAPNLAGIKGIIVQSRYDLLCPPANAARLAALWPEAELRLIEAAGHSMGETAVFAALKAAIAELCG